MVFRASTTTLATAVGRLVTSSASARPSLARSAAMGRRGYAQMATAASVSSASSSSEREQVRHDWLCCYKYI